jgi:hypothetical protein
MPFQKGQSGNPAGRPRGVPDRRQAIRDLLMPDAPELVSRAVQMALEGDQILLKACLDKLIPNARSRSEVEFQNEGGVVSSGRSILQQVSAGGFSLEEGRAALELLAIQGRLEEQAELATRVAILEEALGVD